MCKVRVLVVTVCLFALAAAAARAAAPHELVVEPPTLECAGFHWRITGDGNSNATATIEFRKKGQAEWRKGLDFMRFDAGGHQFVAGSLFDLEPGTDYEARITLVDPDGVAVGAEALAEAAAGATRTVTFTTRAEPRMPEGGRVFHLYPDDHEGAKQQPAFDLDALRDRLGSFVATSDDRNLRPGDIIDVHAGEYTVGPNLDRVRTKPVEDVSTADLPRMPEDATTWHVYPPGYKGETQEPLLGNKRWGGNWIRKFQKDEEDRIKPGDTILMHEGTYGAKRMDYRDKFFGARPLWGVWRIWQGGEPGKPVRLKAAEGEQVILDGDGAYALFELIGTQNIWLDGLTIRNAHCGIVAGRIPYGNGSCDGLVVTNCKFEDVAMPIYNDTVAKDWHLLGNEGIESIHTGPWHEAFGTIKIRRGGTEEKPLVFRAAGDGEAVFKGSEGYALFDLLSARNIWFHGLSMRETECAILAGYYPYVSTTGLIMTRCSITDTRAGIHDSQALGSKNYYIADNHLVGRSTGGMNDHKSWGGISVAGQGHVVAFNYLENWQDAIQTGFGDKSIDYESGDYMASTDVYQNIVIHGPDDAVEFDRSFFNARALRNLFFETTTGAQVFSMQGTPGGPNYWIRNVGLKVGSGPFKLPTNAITYHNVFSSGNAGMNKFGGNLHFRNNIFLPLKDAYDGRKRGKNGLIHFNAPAPRNTSDYNAYGTLPEGLLAEKPFTIGRRQVWATLEEFSEATGLEEHSFILEEGWDVFRKMPVPERGMRLGPDQVDLRLKPGAPPVDAGVVLPNINEDYTGEAPDLGPYELDKPLPHYGPRAEK